MRKTIKFQVKAKNDAHIALCHKVPSRCGGNMYEIVLGRKNNKISCIRNLSHKRSENLDQFEGEVLDGDCYTTFWISWTAGQIRVGKSNLYDKPFLCCDYGYDYPVLYLAVSTGPESFGYWRFDENVIFKVNKKIERDSSSDAPNMPNIPMNFQNIDKTQQMIWQYDNGKILYTIKPPLPLLNFGIIKVFDNYCMAAFICWGFNFAIFTV